MAVLDAFPFDDELEMVENVGTDEDGGYCDLMVVPRSDEEHSYDSMVVTKRGRGRPRKNPVHSGIEMPRIVSRQPLKNVWESATGKPKKSNKVPRKPTRAVPNISDPNEHNGFVQRSLRNRGKVNVQSNRPVHFRKSVSHTQAKRNAIEAVNAGMSVKKATKIYNLPEMVVRNLVYKVQRQKKTITGVDDVHDDDNYSSDKHADVLESDDVDSTNVLTKSCVHDETLTDDMTRLTRSKFSGSDSRDKPQRKTRLNRIEEAVSAIRVGCMPLRRAAKIYNIPETTLRRKMKLEVGDTGNEHGSNDQGGDPGFSEINCADEKRFGDPDSQEDGGMDALEEPVADERLLKQHDKSKHQDTDDMKMRAKESVKDQSRDNRGRLRDRDKIKVDDYFSTARKKWTRKSYAPQTLRKAVESYKVGMTMGKAADLHNVNVNFLSKHLQEAGLLPTTSYRSIVESPGLKVDYASVSKLSMSGKSGCGDVSDGAGVAEMKNYRQLWNTYCPSSTTCDSELTCLQDQNILTMDRKSNDHQESMTVSGNLQPWTLLPTGAVEESVEECVVPGTPLGNTLPLTGLVERCRSVEGREAPGTLMLSHSGLQTGESYYSGSVVDHISIKTGRSDCSSHSRNCNNINTDINDDLFHLRDRGKTDETNSVRRLRSHKKLKTNEDDHVSHFNEDGSLIEPRTTGYGVKPQLNKLYTNELLSVALEDMKTGRMSCMEAANHHKIPYGLLQKKYESILSSGPLASPSNGFIGSKQVGHSQPSNQPDGSGFIEVPTDKSFSSPVKRGRGRPRKICKDSSNNLGNRSPTKTNKTDFSENLEGCSSFKSSDTKHHSDSNSISANENGGLGHPSDGKTQNKTRFITRPGKIDKKYYSRRLRARKTIKINTSDHVNHWKNGSVEDPKNTSFGFGVKLSKPHSPQGLRVALVEDIKAGRMSCYDTANSYNASPSIAPSILEQSSDCQSVNQNDTISDSGLNLQFDETGARSSSPKMRWDESQVLKCASCKYETLLKSCIERHVVKHLPENWLKCPKCDFTEENPKTFYKHYLCHEKLQTDVYPCPFCKYTSRKGSHVPRHVSYHRKYPDIYDCRKCDFSTTRPDHLERHKSLYHPKNRKNKTVNMGRARRTDGVNCRKNGGLVVPKITFAGAPTHKQYVKGVRMAPKPDKMSCSDAACHHNIPNFTFFNEHRMSECHVSGHSTNLCNRSTALEHSGDIQSVNQNDSTAGVGETAAAEPVSPPLKRGRGRPRKIQLGDTGGIVKRGRGRPPKMNGTTGTPSQEKRPPASTRRPNADIDLNVPDASWPSLDNDPPKPRFESDIIKRVRERPPKFKKIGIPSSEKLSFGSTFNNVYIDLNGRTTLRPSLDYHYAKPQLESSKCSDMNMPNHHKMKEDTLKDQEKPHSSSESQSHTPVTCCPELQPADSDYEPRVLDKIDHRCQCQRLSNKLRPSSFILESLTENSVCQVYPIQEKPLHRPSDTLQGCSYGSRSPQGATIASSQFEKESWNLRDLMPDSSPDHKPNITCSSVSAFLQPENPSHSSYIQGMPEPNKFVENAEVLAHATGTPILDIRPEPVDVKEECAKQSNTLPDNSDLCPIPGMPVLDRAPPESDVLIVPDIFDGQECRSYCLNQAATTESFPTPPILIPVSPVQSVAVGPAFSNIPPTLKSP